MSIKYVVALKPNPINRELKKYYGIAKAIDVSSYGELCQKISNASSATKGDVSLVLDSLIYELVSNLSSGRIVRLGEFGSFQMSISSAGAERVEDFNHGLIKKCRIVFRPGLLLKDMCATASYEVLDKRLWPEAKI